MAIGRKGDIMRCCVWLDHGQLVATPFPRALVLGQMRYARRLMAETEDADRLGPQRTRVKVEGDRTRIELEATIL